MIKPNRDLSEDEEWKMISPEEMIFHFKLRDTECHQKLTGTCSLQKESSTKDQQEDRGESGYSYCPKLLDSLRKHGCRYYVDLAKYRCGHYAFNDGQHRVCIAQKKGLQLPALITTVHDEDCKMCDPTPYKEEEGEVVTIEENAW